MIDKDDKWKPVRWDLFGVFLAIMVAVLIALAALVSPNANAHVVPHSVCQTYWEQAAPGQKWQAKVECLERVKNHNLKHVCAKPRPIIRGVKVKGVWANATQRKNLTTALNGHRRAETRHLVAMVAAIIQESTAYNNPWGHGTSVGILQLIDEHGTLRWRMVIRNQTTWFISGAKRKDRGQPLGDLAQDVQGSAHPTLYRQWVGEARTIIARFRGPCKA